MKTSTATVLMLCIMLFVAHHAAAWTDLSQEDINDPSLVVNRPVNVQGLTGLIITNSAYTQPRGRMVIGLSAMVEDSTSPDFSIAQGIATITGGITDRIELGAKVKVISTNLGSSKQNKTGAGDADLLIKWRASSEGESLPAIAFGLAYTLPTGDEAKGLREVKHEGIRFMVIGSSEKEMPGGYVLGAYIEGQIVYVDQVRRPVTSPYADKYGVFNFGILLPLTDSRRLQFLVEYHQVVKKTVLTLYDQNLSAVMPGVRYVTPELNISLGVQFLRRDELDVQNNEQYVGTLSYAF
jgi:hypothetical protein